MCYYNVYAVVSLCEMTPHDHTFLDLREKAYLSNLISNSPSVWLHFCNKATAVARMNDAQHSDLD